MTDSNIPPRPWRVSLRPHPYYTNQKRAYIEAGGSAIGQASQREAADLIVRLVNAEPEIVAALRLAEEALACATGRGAGCDCGPCVARESVRAVLAKVAN